MTNTPTRTAFTIGVVGAGNMARALGKPLMAAGHQIVVGARDLTAAHDVARSLGPAAGAAGIDAAVHGADVVLLAVPWSSVDDVLATIGADRGALAGKVIIDPTNPVEHGVGRHLLSVGSAAEHIAERAPGALVAKVFNMHPAGYWESVSARDVVAVAADPRAVETASQLVRDVGATPHVLGDIGRARQLEEVAGAVISLAFAGHPPRSAVPG